MSGTDNNESGAVEAAVKGDALDEDQRARVIAHLETLLASPQFKDTTRMKRFLRYVVEETLSGRGGRLKGYTIGLEVFDRPDDFDPQSDTIVRVQAGQLRRRLDLYYSKGGRDADMRIVVPKGTYAPRFEMRREVAVVAAPTEAESEAETAGAQTFVKAATAPRPDGPGVVVLTLTDLSLHSSGEDTARDYFAEGVTAEIVNALVQFRYLRVVTRTASVTASGPDVGVRKLAERHNVDFVLAGSVRHAGDNIRVSVNLIDANSGMHIYAKVFDREYTVRNMIDIQDEIASYVAASVAAPYGAITRHYRALLPDMELSAYEVILRFYEMSLSPTRHKARVLRTDIDKVLEDNPRLSQPWAVRAILDSFMVGQTLNDMKSDGYRTDALRAAKTAVRLNPDNAMGCLGLLLAEFYSGNMTGYERAAERCVALNPNDAMALAYMAITKAFRGDLEDAHALHARAIELLPRPPRWFASTPAIEMLLAGQYQYVLNTIGSVSPDRGVWSQMVSLAALGHLRRPQVCAQLLEKLRERTPDYDREIKACFLRWQPHERLKEVCLTGWEKAGLKV